MKRLFLNSINHEVIINILRFVVCGKEQVSPPDNVDWKSLCDYALKNHLEVILYHYFKSYRFISDELWKRVELDYYSRISINVKQDECLNQIDSLFRCDNIPYAPQKGSILKDDYPERDMRCMSDIDIYIRQSDRDRIHKLLIANGFSYRGKESGDEQFLLFDKIGVEFHGRLLYRKNSNRIENYPNWNYVDLSNNRLTEEGFALNLLGHAVYDLYNGGPGIRYILDIWIYKHSHSPQPNWNCVLNKLKEDGIFKAAECLLELAEYLFGDLEPNDKIIDLANYVLDGDLHGDSRRSRVIELALVGTRNRAFFNQLFRNRTEYENRYSWVKKFPFLIPFAYLFRVVGSLKSHRHYIFNWKRTISSISEEEIRIQKERMQKWGL